jgi:hypothetical protein
MAQTVGITIEKDIRGKVRYARIDLRKYGKELESFFEKKGVSIEDSVKWTTKMKKSFAEAKKGDVCSRNLDDLLNV